MPTDPIDWEVDYPTYDRIRKITLLHRGDTEAANRQIAKEFSFLLPYATYRIILKGTTVQ